MGREERCVPVEVSFVDRRVVAVDELDVASWRERLGRLLGVLRAAEEHDLAVGEAPPVLHVHRRRLAGRRSPCRSSGRSTITSVSLDVNDSSVNSVTSTFDADLLEEPGHLALAAVAAVPRHRACWRPRPPSRRRRRARRGRRRRRHGRRPRTGAGRLRSSDRTWDVGVVVHVADDARDGRVVASGELPIYGCRRARPTVTQVEIAALLAVAQDHAFGQPPGSQLRATVLGQHLATAAGADAAERATTWWTSALRFLGCTGHAFEVAVVFGDEIELRARSLQADVANPADVLRLMRQPRRTGSSPAWAGSARCSPSSRAARRPPSSTSAPRARSPTPSRCASASTSRCAPRSARTSSAGTAAACPPGPRARRSPDRCGSPSSPGARGPRPRRGDRPRRSRSSGARRGKAYDPDLADLVLDAGRGLVGGGRDRRLLGRGARRRPAVRAARRRGRRTSRCSSSRTSPTSSRRGRAATRGRRRPRPGGVRTATPRPPRWSTTSAASRSPTRSGTSPGPSPATSGTAPRPTRS